MQFGEKFSISKYFVLLVILRVMLYITSLFNYYLITIQLLSYYADMAVRIHLYFLFFFKKNDKSNDRLTLLCQHSRRLVWYITLF
jgi:hypothetical protein